MAESCKTYTYLKKTTVVVLWIKLHRCTLFRPLLLLVDKEMNSCSGTYPMKLHFITIQEPKDFQLLACCPQNIDNVTLETPLSDVRAFFRGNMVHVTLRPNSPLKC